MLFRSSLGDDKIVGFLAVVKTTYFFSTKPKISDIGFYVKPKYRGSSSAVKLLKALENWAKENNISDEKIDEGVIGSIMNEFELIEESYDILKFETIVESDNKVSGSVMPVKGIKLMIKKLTEKGISFEDLQKYFNKSFYSGEVNDKNVYEKILEGIGAKPTPENMKFMYAWRQSEGKAGRYNPFNTTQPMPGATNFNSVGVKHYLSLEDGVNAKIGRAHV